MLRRRKYLARSAVAVLAVTTGLLATITTAQAVSAAPSKPAVPSVKAAKAIPVPTPTLSGPVVTAPHLDGTHGIPYTSSAVDLASHGYTEQEYFVSGTARAYSSANPLTSDGRWSVDVSSQAAYQTRILVRRPIDMSTFSGTVVVEWMNATVGRDLDVGWDFASNEMLNSHDIYVGVSAQALPVDGAAQGLKTWDPERYGSLVHPGDQYSYDIFAQVAQALRHQRGATPIPGHQIRQIIGWGDSQSAFRLTTYADALQNRDQVFDGLLIVSRFGKPAALNATQTPPVDTLIRSDLTAKVLTLETETDIVRSGGSGYLSAQQADTNRFRLWEVAGASHFNAAEEATMRIQAFRESPFADPPIQFNSCTHPMNSLRFTDVNDSALHALDRWVRDPQAQPATPALLQVTADGSAYVRDADGIAVGGIRLPQVTVPVGVEEGAQNTEAGTCSLAGSFTPFSAEKLQALYPTHHDFVKKYTAAVHTAQKQGFIEPYDAAVSIDQAAESSTPALVDVP